MKEDGEGKGGKILFVAIIEFTRFTKIGSK
jgi:hypothetical protein